MTRFPIGTGVHPLDDMTLTARLEAMTAERDALQEAMSTLLQHVLTVGGYMPMDMQTAVRRARALVGER